MTLHNFLIDNEIIINTLSRQGVIPNSILGYKSIYEKVIYEQRVNKKIPTDSYWEVADQLHISVKTVMVAVVRMRKEI